MPVVVHLVHGTRPFGFFTRRKTAIPAWFEEGSRVRQNIEIAAGVPIDFRIFDWTPAKNSMATRIAASRFFYQHLRSALQENAKTFHVVIAHSHGGTIALRCLANLYNSAIGRPRVKALVCLATPFVYLSPRRRLQRNQVRFSFGSVLLGPLLIALLYFCPELTLLHSVPLLPAAELGIMLFSANFFRLHERHWGDLETLHPLLPTFLIRATRDEAAMAIGLAQTLQVLTRLISSAMDYDVDYSLAPMMLAAILGFLTFSTSMVILLYFVGYDSMMLNKVHFLFLEMLCTQFLASSVLFCGYALVAIAAGFYDVRSWPEVDFEIDASPPEKACTLKSYSDLDSSMQKSLRHGIYDHPKVQEEVGAIIRAVALCQSPAFASSSELDDIERRANYSNSLDDPEDYAWWSDLTDF